MSKTYNWGIIGLGKIAHKFAQDLAKLPNARLHAVASRSEERSAAFAKQYGAAHAFGSYEAIVSCPELDVVYVATPHPSHCANTLLCLEHRIPVLCEKPFAMNSNEVAQMIALAKAKNVFLMEALWTRFLPATKRMLEMIKQDTIGEVLSVKADFGFAPVFDAESRLFNPALGGGALLDIGIYPIFFALLVIGVPERLLATAHFGSTGVDEEIGILFDYPNGRMAHLHATFRANTKTEAFVYGTKGTIHLHSNWYAPTSMSLLLKDERPQFIDFEYNTIGYSYEAEEVMRCLMEGETESKNWSLQNSIELMDLLDRIREEISRN